MADIIFDVMKSIHFNLRTLLPYKWNFCRLQRKTDVKLLIDSGSYFIVYAAFLFWCTQYTFKYLRNSTRRSFRGKLSYLVMVLSFVIAAEMVWPLFNLIVYFFTCSFYPWFSTLAVIKLNKPSASSIFTAAKKTCDLLLRAFGDFLQVLNFYHLYIRNEIVGDMSARTTVELSPDASLSENAETHIIESSLLEDGAHHTEHELMIGQKQLTSTGETNTSFTIPVQSSSYSESEISDEIIDVQGNNHIATETEVEQVHENQNTTTDLQSAAKKKSKAAAKKRSKEVPPIRYFSKTRSGLIYGGHI